MLTADTADSFVRANFPVYLETMVRSGVQLATLWQFNGENDRFTDEGLFSFMLEKISGINDRFRAQGLQDTAGMW